VESGGQIFIRGLILLVEMEIGKVEVGG